MAPGSISCYIASILFTSHLVYYFAIFTFQSIQQKYQKFILLSLSDLTFASGREGLTTPLSRWLQGSYLFVQVQGDLRVTSYCIDTLVLKN